jgi:hypothetical protein
VIEERMNTYEDDSNDEDEGKETNYDNNMMEKINNLTEIL